MISSVRAHHQPSEVGFYLLIVDWDGTQPIDLPGVTVVAARDLDIEFFDYMLLKFSALELCCALKPYLLRHIATTSNCQNILYLDSDI